METKNYNQEYYDKLYKELYEAIGEIMPYYKVDKIKDYGVYIWTKEDPNRKEKYFEYAENLFDIYADGIIFYVEDHKIPDEVMPIIKKIQDKLLKVKFNFEVQSQYHIDLNNYDSHIEICETINIFGLKELSIEFKRLGYEEFVVSLSDNYIKIVSSEKTVEIFVDLDEKRYGKTYLNDTMFCWITHQEHQLLTKLFKAWNWL